MAEEKTGAGERISPVSVQQFLKGVDYPASKDDLLRRARDNGAPEEVVRLIREMPRDEFGGPQDVMKGYGEVESG